MTAAAHVTPESRPRSRAIFALLASCLVLVGGLAYQAISASRSQAATARQLLQEYTRLAVEEFVRRGTVEVGYYGLYLLSTELDRRAGSLAPQELPDSLALSRSADPQLRRAATLVRALHPLGSGDGLADPFTIELEKQAQLAPLHDQDSAFTIKYIRIDGQRRTIAFLPDGQARLTGAYWLAIEIEDTAFAGWFQAALERGSLLPSAPGGAMPNEKLAIRVLDPDQITVFSVGAASDDALVVERGFPGSYGGLFHDYKAAVSIDPTAAAGMVEGWLPSNRVPILLALLSVSVALLIAAIALIRREHTMMEAHDDFIARTSHELRTPLTQIRMFAETLLLDRIREPSDRLRFIEIILRESRRLGQLVDNVLHFSAGGRFREGSAMVLAPATREVVAEFEPLARQAALEIECRLDEAVTARVNRGAYRQILLNLLDNAAKYAPGGAVRIRLEYDGSHAKLCVEDDGPGIPAGEEARIFARFYRLPREIRTGTSGTGIGLAVVRDLVRQHGGDCEVTSGEGAGARFAVYLPAAGPACGESRA